MKSYRYRTKGNTNYRVLRLSVKRKKNKGENLQIWRQRQKELAALREAGLLEDTSENFSAQNISSAQQVTDEPVYILPDFPNVSHDTNAAEGTSLVMQDTSIAEVACNEPLTATQVPSGVQNANIAQIVSDVQNSNITETASSVQNVNIIQTTSNIQNVNIMPTSVPNNTVLKSSKKITSDKESRTWHGISVAVQTYKSPKARAAKPLPKEAALRGRRIIDFKYFFNEIRCLNNHSDSNCNLDDIYITNERKYGLLSCFNVKCSICDFEKVIFSESRAKNRNINTDAIIGMLGINCDFSDMNRILSRMNLPQLSQGVYAKECEKIASVKIITKDITGKVVGESVKTIRVPRQVEINAGLSLEAIQLKKASALAKKICQKRSQNIEVAAGQHQSTSETEPVSHSSEGMEISEDVVSVELLVKDEFEVEEKDSDSEEESLMPEQIGMKTCDGKFSVDQEMAALNIPVIKKEIALHKDKEKQTISESNINMEPLNENSTIKFNGQPQIMTQNVAARTVDDRIVANQEQIELSDKTAKHEIQNDSELDKSICENKNVAVKPDKTNAALFPKDSTVFENTMVVDQEHNKLDTEANQSLSKSYEGLPKSILNYVKTDQEKFSYSCEANKNRASLSVTKINSAAEVQRMSESSGSTIVSQSSVTSGGNNLLLMALQRTSKPDEKATGLRSQLSTNVLNGSFPDANKTAFIPGVSTGIQQPTFVSNNIFPMATDHPGWTSGYTPMSNTPLILLPGVSGTTFMPTAPSTIQQSANVSTNGFAVPMAPAYSTAATTAQQPASSTNSGFMVPITHANSTAPSTIQQPANLRSNEFVAPANSRWVGRGNMNNNNPFFTLPGGAPKGVSDPVPPKPNGNKSNGQSKRTLFRCEECDLNFAKYDSWDSHKKSYCITRLKFPPSSTVTSDMLVDNPVQQIQLINEVSDVLTSNIKPPVEELYSAMAIKRSCLEAAMKTALDAQYIISLHKTAQDLTRKAFKELDDVLNQEKSLKIEASREEKQKVSKARSKALMKAEAAYMQEKYSRSAVEQALYRQKSSIEASLTATGHEQTAFISALTDLKRQTNQNTVHPVLQKLHEELLVITELSKEKLKEASFVQTTEVDGFFSPGSDISDKHSSISSDILIKQKSHIDPPSHPNVLHNFSHLDTHPEKVTPITSKKFKTVTQEILHNNCPQFEGVNATISSSNNDDDITALQSDKNRLVHSDIHLEGNKNLNDAASHGANLISLSDYQKENMSHHYLPMEMEDINSAFPQNSQDTIQQVKKSLTQIDEIQEKMDLSDSSDKTFNY